MKILFFALLFIGLLLNRAQADDVYVVIQKQQEKKKQSRWSLGEWMIQERKIRLMDQWLAQNTEEIGAEWRLYYRSVSTDRSILSADTSGADYGLELFYGFLGVGYENMSSDGDKLLNSTKVKIKIIGSSQQSTHLNVFAGLSSGVDPDNSNANVYGYEGDLYFFGAFGYSFRYEEHKSASGASASSSFDGLYRSNALFIESGFIRLSYALFYLDYKESTTPFKDEGSKISVDFNF